MGERSVGSVGPISNLAACQWEGQKPWESIQVRGRERAPRAEKHSGRTLCIWETVGSARQCRLRFNSCRRGESGQRPFADFDVVKMVQIGDGKARDGKRAPRFDLSNLARCGSPLVGSRQNGRQVNRYESKVPGKTETAGTPTHQAWYPAWVFARALPEASLQSWSGRAGRQPPSGVGRVPTGLGCFRGERACQVASVDSRVCLQARWGDSPSRTSGTTVSAWVVLTMKGRVTSHLLGSGEDCSGKGGG